ncbi:XRE family transcriptional regulator [Conexibacter stalactiti]|uniref:XRE family transcriptional regulator n=1 Tax=Conexibacter stalactiti TaxID=1940611 RepID=A0ABU4HT87_9ACTN|nr:XRE family transcriptional regulator [Conexibacter stalactiti]MDW5596537.1 XRE family transcriptional regulator [Conexibacter stalactiti]MEC5037179.1 XRE family transcriptional regulator [Conexibacter stalactiti]
MPPPRKTEEGPPADATHVALRDVGARLRRDREARGVGVRELARRIGVSPSLISAIELGKANPSIGTLYQIVDELGLSVDELMREGGGDAALAGGASAGSGGAVVGGREPVVQRAGDGGDGAVEGALLRAHALVDAPLGHERDDPVQRVDSRSSVNLPGVRWERLTAHDDAAVDFLYVTYEVGAESCPEDNLMRHGGYEYGLILEGRLGIRIGFRSFELGPGDSISFDSMEPHRFWTLGDEPSRSVWLVVRRRNDPRMADQSFD